MDALVAAHSGIRWLVLLGLVAVVAWGFTGTRTTLAGWVRGVGGLFTIQVVLGIVLYIANSGWEQGGFIAFWHPLAMIVALGVFQVGTARAGRDERPGWIVATFTLVAIVLVLAGIPWARGMA